MIKVKKIIKWDKIKRNTNRKKKPNASTTSKKQFSTDDSRGDFWLWALALEQYLVITKIIILYFEKFFFPLLKSNLIIMLQKLSVF